MTEQMMSAIGSYGPVALFFILAINCLGVPFPTSLLMLAVGSLVVQGEMDLAPVLAWGISGAVAGDQAGYLVGRVGGPPVVEAAARRVGVTANLERARALGARWGAAGVFFSRWLLSPLGPYVNLVSGMAPLPWPVFTAWGIAGEVVWVSLYITLGSIFSESVQRLSEVLGNFSWFLVGAVATAVVGWMLVRSFTHHPHGPAHR